MKFVMKSVFFAVLVMALLSGCQDPGKSNENIGTTGETGSLSLSGDSTGTARTAVQYTISWTEYTGNCENYNVDTTTLKTRTISTVAIAYCPSCVLRFRNWVVNYGPAVIENPYSRVTTVTRTGDGNVSIVAQYYVTGG